MLLASVDQIRLSLGFDDMPDVKAAITEALHVAETVIASVLTTEFTQTTRKDRFWVSRPRFTEGVYNETKFRLSSGCVDNLTCLIGTVPTGVGAVAADMAQFQIDLDKGIVTDIVTNYNQQYVVFSYTSGFPADADNPESYDLTDVPVWLQDAARIKAKLLLSDNPSMTNLKADMNVTMLETQYATLIHQHQRYAPTALLPA